MKPTYTKADDLSFEVQQDICKRYHEAKSKYKFSDEMLEEFNLRNREMIAIVRKFPKPDKLKAAAEEYKKLVQHRIKMIKEAINIKGLYDINDIAKYVGVNIQVLRRIAVDENICIKRGVLLAKRVITLLQDGESVRDIAVRYKVSANIVNRIAINADIVLKPEQKHSREYVQQIEAEVVDFCNNNEWSFAATINKFSLTEGEFRTIINKYNISKPVQVVVKPNIKERYAGLPDRFVIRNGVFYHSNNAGHLGAVLNWARYIVRDEGGQNNG